MTGLIGRPHRGMLTLLGQKGSQKSLITYPCLEGFLILADHTFILYVQGKKRGDSQGD